MKRVGTRRHDPFLRPECQVDLGGARIQGGRAPGRGMGSAAEAGGVQRAGARRGPEKEAREEERQEDVHDK